MIQAEIIVPCIPQSFDFLLEEQLKAGQAAEQILQILAERYEVLGKPEEYVLMDADRRKPLPREGRLAACGVKSGSRLLLL